MGGQAREFEDKQTVYAQKFNYSTKIDSMQKDAITVDVTCGQSIKNGTETGRFALIFDPTTGEDISQEYKTIQHKTLPTTNTSLIKVSYELVAELYHDSMLGSSVCIPPISIPIEIVPLDEENRLRLQQTGSITRPVRNSMALQQQPNNLLMPPSDYNNQQNRYSQQFQQNPAMNMNMPMNAPEYAAMQQMPNNPNMMNNQGRQMT